MEEEPASRGALTPLTYGHINPTAPSNSTSTPASPAPDRQMAPCPSFRHNGAYMAPTAATVTTAKRLTFVTSDNTTLRNRYLGGYNSEANSVSGSYTCLVRADLLLVPCYERQCYL
jgi:hypothetical protein